jgi:hypothetical protein
MNTICLTAATEGAASIAVGIEVPHGPVVETLLKRGFGVHTINPKELDRFRDRFSMSGAKDDRRDALVLADGLRADGIATSGLSRSGRADTLCEPLSRSAMALLPSDAGDHA